MQVPVRLRVDSAALSRGQDQIADALAAALSRALATARDQTESAGRRPRIRHHPPSITWSGPNAANVPAGLRADTDALVSRVVARAVSSGKGASVSARRPTKVRRRAGPPAERDPFARPPWSALREPPKPPKVIDYIAVAKRLRGADGTDRAIAFLDIHGAVLAGDVTAFRMALWAIRPDDAPPTELILNTLRDFAKRNPKSFRRLLGDVLRSVPRDQSMSLERWQNQLAIKTVDEETQTRWIGLADILAGAIRVGRDIPAARDLLDEWERETPGIVRIIALVQALVDVRTKFLKYLKDRKPPTTEQLLTTFITGHVEPPPEITDPAVLHQIESVNATLMRIPALLIAGAGDERVRRMVHDLELDLVENYRWISHTFERIQLIDGILHFYRDAYGAAAGLQEEVKVLGEARALYLSKVVENRFPTASFVEALRRVADAFFADWQGKAGDTKIGKLDETLGKLEVATSADNMQGVTDTEIDEDDPWSGPQWRSMLSGFNKYFNDRYVETINGISALRHDVQNARGEQASTRGRRYLDHIRSMEQKLAPLILKTALLEIWFGTHQLEVGIVRMSGWTSRRTGWMNKIVALRFRLEQEFVSPDVVNFKEHLGWWGDEIKSIASDIGSTRRQERAIRIGFLVVGMIATFGVASVLAGEGVLVISLAEAGTLTVVTTIEKVVLDKPITLGGTIEEFALNAAMFGFGRILHGALVAKAVQLAPERALLQLAIVYGGDFVYNTVASLAIQTIETGELPEDISSFLAVSAIINVIVAGLTRGAVRAELEAASARELLAQTLALETKRQNWLKGMNEVLATRQPTPEEFAEAQRAGAAICDDLEAVFRGFSRLSPETLGRLGLSRGRVQEVMALARSYGSQIRGAPAAGQRLLPSPTEVAGGLVVRRGGALEIVNPNAPGSDPTSLAKRLRRAGYMVQVDGGILRLSGPKGSGQEYLLLPAAADIPDPALASIVGSPRTNSYKGLTVLRGQSAVPPLEARIASLARSDTGAAQDILAGMGRHIGTTDVREIQGMYRFLELGGSPRALAAALGNGRNRGTNSVLKALRQFNDLTSADVRGFDVIVNVLGTGPSATDTIAGIGSNFVPSRSVYGAIADVAPFVDTGLPEVLRYLRSWSQNLNQAGIGSLLGGQQMLRERPGGRIDFEFEIYKGEQLIRVVDVRYRLPAGDPLGRLKGEVKEVVDVRVLQFRSAREFAKDVLDEIGDPPPASYRPLARLRWLVRRPSGKSDQELEAIQESVKAILRRGFDDPLLASHPRRSELLKEFDDYFGEIFRWLVGPTIALSPTSRGGPGGPSASSAAGLSRGKAISPSTIALAAERAGALTDEMIGGLDRLVASDEGRASAADLIGRMPARNVQPALELLGRVTPEDAKVLLDGRFLPALSRNPRALAFAGQPGAVPLLRKLVGVGGLTSRFGEDREVVFGILDRVLRKHATASPQEVAGVVDRLASPLSELSEADLRRAVGDVDDATAKLLDKVTNDDLKLLRGNIDDKALTVLRTKLSDDELRRIYDALFPGKTSAVWRPRSYPHIEGKKIPQGEIDPIAGEVIRPGPDRLDAKDLLLLADEELADAMKRIGRVIGKRISDNEAVAKVWEQARQDVLKGRDPHVDVSQEEMNYKGGIYDRVRDRFWKLLRQKANQTAYDHFLEAGFDMSGEGAPLLETNLKRPLIDEMRRISLDHMEGFEKALGRNYRFAVDAANLSFEFQYPNTLRDAIGRRLGLGPYTKPRLP